METAKLDLDYVIYPDSPEEVQKEELRQADREMAIRFTCRWLIYRMDRLLVPAAIYRSAGSISHRFRSVMIPFETPILSADWFQSD